MDFAQFVKSLEAPEAVYVLPAPQAYLRDRVYEECLRQVPEEARAFDWGVFDLEKDEAAEVVAVARTLPWMSPRRWVFVRNAQMGEGPLTEYLGAPSARTALVLETSKKVPKWSKLTSVEMGAAGRPESWIRTKVAQEGFQIDPQSVDLLVDLVGEDLQRLESELEKQFLWQWDSKKITVDSVLRLTVEARERDVFELISAIAERRREAALRILDRLFTARMAPPQILALLYWNFRRLLVAKERLELGEPFFSIVKSLKIWSYKDQQKQIRSYSREFLTDVVLKIRETDRLCKSSGLAPRLYLERIILDTCRAKSD